MAAAPDVGMDKADLKKLLVKSKEEPVNCAVGLGKDQQAMILLHRTKSPPTLLKELEKQAGGPLKAPCHGTALVDFDGDPTLVILTVNKAASGIAAKLKKTLRGTGFTKAMIRLEDGTVVDRADEEEGDADTPAGPPAQPEQLAAAAAAGPSVEALSKELAALVRRIPDAIAADPTSKAALTKLATDANANLKANKLDAASGCIAQLRDALRDAPAAAGVGTGQVAQQAAPSGPTPPPAPPLAKPAAGPGVEALTKELAALIRRIPDAIAADPTSKAPLTKLATDANANLKANRLDAASDCIAQLRDALGDAPGAAGTGQAARPAADAAAAANAGPAAAAKPLQVWLDAKDDANEQIGKLQTAMRSLRHPLFDRVADQGLNGITGRLQVGLQVALTEVDHASGTARAAAQTKARAVVADFRNFLTTDPVLPVLEKNPLGVKVTLRAGLGQALDAIDKALAA